MSEHKHTPGPWHARPPTAQNPSRAVVSALSGGVTIYEAPLTLETAANARLIAAAPDLLTVCRLALPILREYREGIFASNQIDGVVRDAAEKADLDTIDAVILLADNAVAGAAPSRVMVCERLEVAMDVAAMLNAAEGHGRPTPPHHHGERDAKLNGGG